jgi:hypothetical protein
MFRISAFGIHSGIRVSLFLRHSAFGIDGFRHGNSECRNQKQIRNPNPRMKCRMQNAETQTVVLTLDDPVLMGSV